MNLFRYLNSFILFFWRVEFEMRVVLVEDNQMLAQGIQKVLLDEGHSVDYFIDGRFC